MYFFANTNTQIHKYHLKYFQEKVNVKPPDAKALSDDSKEEGDADDEEDGGQEDVDGGEDQ